MAITRTLQSLQVYDILANLIPGTVLLIVLVLILRVEAYINDIPASLLVATSIVVGFVLGHLIQSVSSKLNGQPRLFGQTVAEMRQVEPYDPDGTLEILPERIREWVGLKRATRSDLYITEVEEEFWPMAKEYFDLSDDFSNHGRLMQLVLSYLETTPATRALRFQSIHTFQRSMWGVWILSVLLVITISVGDYCGVITARSPALLVGVGAGSLGGIWAFGKRKEKFNRKFVEYVFVDFYTEQKRQE